jgi:hypothetical protein
MVAWMATLGEVLVAAEVGEKVDREGAIRAKRGGPSSKDRLEADAVLANPDAAL